MCSKGGDYMLSLLLYTTLLNNGMDMSSTMTF